MNLNELVALPGFRPKDFQSEAPPGLFDRGLPVADSADLQRILKLPRRAPLDVDNPESPEVHAYIEYAMQKYGRPNLSCNCASIDRFRSCITRLLPVQAWALQEMTLAGGLLGSIPVGAGKTIIGILAPLALGVRCALLLIPPSLVEQIIIDYKMLIEHFRVPAITVHAGDDRRPALRNTENCDPDVMLHVLPYSRLQQPEASDWLEGLQPEAIIADECDALKDLNSARSRRVLRYFSGQDLKTPEERVKRAKTRFCGWTGSITDHSICEYSTLAAYALKLRSPVPINPNDAKDWGRCLDAVPNPCPPGALLQLCEPGESVREAFRRRLRDTLGFIVTTSSNVVVHGGTASVDISVKECVVNHIPDIIHEALKAVREFRRPDTLAGSLDDEELVDALAQAKTAQEVATGMFYRWIFPRGEPVDLIKEWFAARKLWNKEVRTKLMEGEVYLDSPKLCENAAKRAWGDMEKDPKRPEWKALNWPRWREVKELVRPATEAVRLHPFLAEDAARWGMQNRGIIWYGMVEFAQWIHELSGLPVHGGGPNAGKRLREEVDGSRSIIASIKSHGRGRDGLQHFFHEQLVANTPASARQWQQLLGRLHRRGQKEEEVITHVYLHTPELKKAFAQAIRRGEYVEDTFGERQKLLEGFGISVRDLEDF